MSLPLHWTLYCRVIDNHGDLGVNWRLARSLVGLGDRVRLCVDDASALAWMAKPPDALDASIEVLPFDAPRPDAWTPQDVVVESFGCDPPAAIVESMALSPKAPVWINLEYLSAEPHAALQHGLPSPQWVGPGKGLTKWFFYPGFSPDTGGLLLQASSAARALQDDPGLQTVLAAMHQATQRGERNLSVFGYPSADLDTLWAACNEAPTRVWWWPGALADAASAALGRWPRLQCERLPTLHQAAFDTVLARCDFNVVRGEDSLVSALAAGRPFVWNIYPQSDWAHQAKLEAFLQTWLGDPDTPGRPAIDRVIRAHMARLNRLTGWPLEHDAALTGVDLRLDAAALAAWQRRLAPWRQALLAREGLALQLRRFALAHQP